MHLPALPPRFASRPAWAARARQAADGLAWFVSAISHPVWVPAFGAALFARAFPRTFGAAQDAGMQAALQAHEGLLGSPRTQGIAAAIALGTILPLLLVGGYTWLGGKGKDGLLLKKRQDRTAIYLITLPCFALWLAATLYAVLGNRDSQGTQHLLPFAAGATLSLAAVLLINFRAKISAHTTAIGGLTAYAAYLVWIGQLPPATLRWVLIGSVLTGLSRLWLQAHTPIQVFAGYWVGAIGGLAAVAAFG